MIHDGLGGAASKQAALPAQETQNKHCLPKTQRDTQLDTSTDASGQAFL